MSDEAPKIGSRGGIAMVSALVLMGGGLGVLGFKNYSSTEGVIARKLADMAARGASMSTDECVDDVLVWHDEICLKEAIAPMCITAVPMAMAHCLAAKDRAADCAAYGNVYPSSQWAFHKCNERGVSRDSKAPQKKSCTAAWRALDYYCKSGHTDVRL